MFGDNPLRPLKMRVSVFENKGSKYALYDDSDFGVMVYGIERFYKREDDAIGSCDAGMVFKK